MIKRFDKTSRYITPSKYYAWELSKWIPGYDQYAKELILKLTDIEYRGRWPGSSSGILFNNMQFSSYDKKKYLADILGEFLNKCFNSIANGKKFFVEDNTWNILFAKELVELLPKSKIIHVYRDPRDVISSFLQQPWSPSNVPDATLFYESLMNKWLDIRQNLDSNSYIEIKFEELIRQPAKTLTIICDFIQLPFEKDMLNIELFNKNIGKWKKVLNNEEKNLIKKQLGKVFAEYKYE